MNKLKSVLVIDTPENCYSCPLCVARVKNNKLIYLCNIPELEGVDILIRSIPNAETSKPTWCPLLPLPERKDLHEEVASYNLYQQGYNDCLYDLMEK